MKLFNTILPFAALATAFVIPDEAVMNQLTLEALEAGNEAGSVSGKPDCSRSWTGDEDSADADADIFDTTDFDIVNFASPDDSASWKDDFSDVVEAIPDAFDHAVHSIKDSFVSASDRLQDYEFDHPPHGPPKDPKGPGKHPHKPHRPHKPHHPPNLTVYEMISKSKYTTKFAELVNQFDDVVELLNSTKANVTVFVPTDKAFEKIPDHGQKPPKEILEKVLAYHIVPSFYPAGRVFHSHTIPTLLNGSYLSDEPSKTPQRLAVKLGWTGLFIDNYAKVRYPDIFGTNGVVHGVDSILIPPPSIAAIVGHSPTPFSTLNLAILKSGLELKEPHLGGTFFAPPNFAWAKLGPRINAFLFSKYGAKYLKAILKYHIVANQTLYSDAYYGPKDEGAAKDIPKGVFHVDLPTLLEGRSLSVDIGRYGRLISMKINGFTKVIYQDGIAKDGVIQAVNHVLLPPKTPGKEFSHYHEELTVASLKERLDPFVEGDDEAEDGAENQWYEEHGGENVWDEETASIRDRVDDQIPMNIEL